MASSILSNKLPETTGTPEQAFASKHAWLLRWAMHFTQNDRAAAEDLVQEAFVKLLLCWDSLDDTRNMEPLLYSYVKYAHLTERRKGQNYSFQSLSTIEFDTLSIRLRMADTPDLLALQNELRAIVAYLLWRKPAAKFASVFLLRFFHGYFPDEIMRICLVTRHAVDLSLRYAREEVRSHFAAEKQIRTVSRSAPVELSPRGAAVSAQEFAEELRRTIFSSPAGACLQSAHLLKRYEAIRAVPLDSDLLSHLVSCERCLDLVAKTCDLPPASKRALGDTAGWATRSRASQKGSPASGKQALARVMLTARARLQEIYEHSPSGLMIAVNGQVVAVRDISSARSVLKVDTHSLETLRLIEVISEQGLPLLVFPLLQLPPAIGPELLHQTTMSAGRKVSLLVQFTTDGALLEVVYEDPSLLAAPAMEEVVSREIASSLQDDSALANPETMPARWRRLFLTLGAPRFTNPVKGLLFATLLLGAALSLLLGTLHRHSMPQPETLLNHAVLAENHPSAAAGIVHQRVRIRSANFSLHRDIYRDIQGKRRPKNHLPEQGEQRTRELLEKAGIDWDDPLSAAAYKLWHDHAAHRTDRVESLDNDLIRLSTTTDDPLTRKESITLRASDLHPVVRSVELRDNQTFEVAELTYSIVPWDWGKETEEWFEPLAAPRPHSPQRQPYLASHLVEHLSDSYLDEIQLRVMLALSQLHADAERITVSRQLSGVEVSGVVETEERKQQISSSLQWIPHLVTRIRSYKDMENTSPPGTAGTIVQAVSVDSAVSPMDTYCEAHHLEQQECRRIAYQILDSSTAMSRGSRQIGDLTTGFTAEPTLTHQAATIRDTLLLEDLAKIGAAVRDQQSAVAALHPPPLQPPHSQASTNLQSIATLAQANMALTRELVYAGSEPARQTDELLAQLAASCGSLESSTANLFSTIQAGKASTENVHVSHP